MDWVMARDGLGDGLGWIGKDWYGSGSIEMDWD